MASQDFVKLTWRPALGWQFRVRCACGVEESLWSKQLSPWRRLIRSRGWMVTPDKVRCPVCPHPLAGPQPWAVGKTRIPEVLRIWSELGRFNGQKIGELMNPPITRQRVGQLRASAIARGLVSAGTRELNVLIREGLNDHSKD